jgi:phosphohistidine phosphatase SixA
MAEQKRQIVSAGLIEQAFPASPLPKGDAEVSRVQRWSGVDAAGEMADNLVAEKVQGDAVGVSPGQRAAETVDIEPLRIV